MRFLPAHFVRLNCSVGLEEVAPKMLTQTLRGLERDGLIERVAYTASSLRVEYRLTDIARHLLTALDELCRWSQAHGPHTLVARSRYDAQKCAAPTTSRRAAVAIVGFVSLD